MKNLKLPPKIIKFFDDEEKELIESIENSDVETIPYPKDHPIYQKVRNAALNTSLSKPISIRINTDTLEQIKKQAKSAGLPYQTLIKSILHQHVNKE